jgi:hypothetical protein
MVGSKNGVIYLDFGTKGMEMGICIDSERVVVNHSFMC